MNSLLVLGLISMVFGTGSPARAGGRECGGEPQHLVEHYINRTAQGQFLTVEICKKGEVEYIQIERRLGPGMSGVFPTSILHKRELVTDVSLTDGNIPFIEYILFIEPREGFPLSGENVFVLGINRENPELEIRINKAGDPGNERLLRKTQPQSPVSP